MIGPRWLQRLIGKRPRDWVRYNILNGYARRHYSQEGEDVILSRIFEHQPKGFYVDVGAHHPKRFSNTYLLYKRGWRGIVIDPNPGTARKFKKVRPRDLAVEAAITLESNQQIKFHQFDDPALNTVVPGVAQEIIIAGGFRPVGTLSVPSRTLADVLNAHAKAFSSIDLLTIDAEGSDLTILKSNDWSRFASRIVTVELSGYSVAQALRSPIARFLSERGYEMVAKTANTAFFDAARSAPSSQGTRQLERCSRAETSDC